MSGHHRKLVEDHESWRGYSRAERLAIYDKSWGEVAATIEGRLGRGTSLEDLVRVWEGIAGAYRGFIPDFARVLGMPIDLARFADEKPPNRLVVVGGRYVSSPVALTTDALIDVIARYVDPAVDCIVEFGSGLGFNLARLRLRFPAAPVTYIACEPTAMGRQATRRIFSTDPATHLRDYAFDYCRPDLNFLSGFRKIVAFTAHSIEQVPVLGESFYRMLLDTNIAACVHIEPVGWQRFDNIVAAVLAWHRDEAVWRRFLDGYNFVLDDSRVVDNAAVWSTRGGYNTDLLRLIAAAEARGDVSVTDLAYDVIGLNPFNPSTLVAWRRNRASR
jgi:hypothetical protein